MIDTTSEAAPRRLEKLWALASRRQVIGSAGVFSLVAGALFGMNWVSAHRAFWGGQFECNGLRPRNR